MSLLKFGQRSLQHLKTSLTWILHNIFFVSLRLQRTGPSGDNININSTTKEIFVKKKVTSSEYFKVEDNGNRPVEERGKQRCYRDEHPLWTLGNYYVVQGGPTKLYLRILSSNLI